MAKFLGCPINIVVGLETNLLSGQGTLRISEMAVTAARSFLMTVRERWAQNRMQLLSDKVKTSIIAVFPTFSVFALL